MVECNEIKKIWNFLKNLLTVILTLFNVNINVFISILIYWYLGLPITINQPDAANDKLEGAAWLIALIGIIM